MDIEQIKTMKNDHDNIVTLMGDVKYLKESQEGFHIEMRKSMDDLKNNYKGQLDDHEKRIRGLEGSIKDLPVITKLVYGAVSLILVAVLSALIYLVIKK